MADYIVHGETLTDIADAIRLKKGTTAPILVSDFANEIGTIESESHDRYIPQYTEELIMDNTAKSTSITFTKDWHNYQMLKIELVNTSSSSFPSDVQFIVPEGIDKAFEYSSGKFCVNQIYGNGEATNQYATYSKVDNNPLNWTRVSSRNIHLLKVYGITFVKTTLTKTVLYSKDASVDNAYVTPTPAEGTSFFDYDAIMYMSCTTDTGITRFSKIWISKPSPCMYTDEEAAVYPQRMFEYNSSTRSLNYTATSIGTQRYFYVVGLKFT